MEKTICRKNLKTTKKHAEIKWKIFFELTFKKRGNRNKG